MAYLHSLTKREEEVLELVALGFTNLQIAAILCIALHTVRTHLNRIYSKLDISASSGTARIQAALKAGKLVYVGARLAHQTFLERLPDSEVEGPEAYA